MQDIHVTDGRLRSLGARLSRTRSAIWAVMTLERLWPLLLPFVLLLGLFLSLSWFGVFRMVPEVGRFILLGVLGLAALAALIPFRHLRFPEREEIDRRIEGANKLQHAPISTQTDRLASGVSNPFADALWREHQKRMAEKLASLHADLPSTNIPERDPFALRAAVALLFVVAAAYATGPYGGSVRDAFHAPVPSSEAITARIDAWVTPPPYTGRAPVFLTADVNRDKQEFTVPENSTVSVRISSGSGEENLTLTDANGEQQVVEPEEGSTAGAAQFSQVLVGESSVTLADGSRELSTWHFKIIQDAPPVIRFEKDPRRAANGALELSYFVQDDHGVTKAEAQFGLVDENPNAKPLYDAPEMPLSLPRRSSKDNVAKVAKDLTEHPWAGREVELKLTATDAAGQTGESETKTFTLPQRSFTNSLARAIVEQRQVLALDANQKRRTMAMMDAVLLWADETITNPAHFLLLSSIRSRLGFARNDEALRGVVDDLWEIALIIEDGDLTAAERRLRDAQEALKQALENGATDEELKRLMDELRTAMRDFLREFAERAMQNPQDLAQAPEGQMMNQMDLERMLDQLEDLARSGAREQAQDLLSQLQNMMNNLQAGRPQQGQQGQQNSQMRQQMDQLGEIMRRQQELLNETFRMDREQRGQQGQQGQQGQRGQQGQQGQQGQGQQPGQGQGMTAEEFAEALRQLQEGQGQLRDKLQELTEALRGMGMEPGEGFGEAGEAMGEAEGALGEGEGQRATGEQGRALEALRRGAQDMMQQMQQAMQQGQDGQDGPGQRAGRADRDPLGRPRATTGPDFGDSVDVPDEIDIQRAREIFDAIRRRLGDALSPELEREYLERLLEMR